MAVGALADQMEKSFINYMEVFLPILLQGLSNNDEYQVSTACDCRLPVSLEETFGAKN